jgi:hypothetical protein
MFPYLARSFRRRVGLQGGENRLLLLTMPRLRCPETAAVAASPHALHDASGANRDATSPITSRRQTAIPKEVCDALVGLNHVGKSKAAASP